MSTKLQVQSFYHIELGNTWRDKIYDVQIVGMSSVTNVNELDPSVNIKKEFFTDYKLSISKYLLLITDSTIIYVAKPIKTYDPVVIDEDVRFFIPESLIDFSSSYKYENAKRYDFIASTGIKQFKNLLTESEFLDESIISIRKAVNNIDEFVSDTVSISVKDTDLITTKNTLAEIDKQRKYLINNRNTALEQEKRNAELKERNLYTKTKEAEKAIVAYEEVKEDLESQIAGVNDLQVQNEQENNILLGVKSIMIEMINKIRNGEFSPEDFPTFDELYQQVKEEMYG